MWGNNRRKTMWIVKINDYQRHSAWNSKKEAIKQFEVLVDYGYLKGESEDFIEFDETVNCENGHYYV